MKITLKTNSTYILYYSQSLEKYLLIIFVVLALPFIMQFAVDPRILCISAPMVIELNFIFANCSNEIPFQRQTTILRTNVTRKVLSLCAYIKTQSKLCSLYFRHKAILHCVSLLVLKLRSQGNSLLSASLPSCSFLPIGGDFPFY